MDGLGVIFSLEDIVVIDDDISAILSDYDRTLSPTPLVKNDNN